MGNFVRLEIGALGMFGLGWVGWLILWLVSLRCRKLVGVACGRLGGKDLEISGVILGCLKLKH